MALLCQACVGVEPDEPLGAADLALDGSSGKDLYFKGTFGGDGRTCISCHSEKTGTLAPAEIAALYASKPSDPLFLALDSDDGAGVSYSRLISHATVRVPIDLPANVTLAADPAQRRVYFERGILGTFDTPALDPVVMWDGRVPDIKEQARAAISIHAEAPGPLNEDDLARIASFEQDNLFSSKALEKYAKGCGPAPGLPNATTPSQARGRAFFTPPSPSALCAGCHSGALLNTTNGFAPGLPAGARFANTRISAFNKRGLPVLTFLFAGPSGAVTVASSDPGRALITGDPKDTDHFKIPTLRNIKNTAPYFHDSSAKTLEEVVAHYARFFSTTSNGSTKLTAKDQADIVAYLKLL